MGPGAHHSPREGNRHRLGVAALEFGGPPAGRPWPWPGRPWPGARKLRGARCPGSSSGSLRPALGLDLGHGWKRTSVRAYQHLARRLQRCHLQRPLFTVGFRQLSDCPGSGPRARPKRRFLRQRRRRWAGDPIAQPIGSGVLHDRINHRAGRSASPRAPLPGILSLFDPIAYPIALGWVADRILGSSPGSLPSGCPPGLTSDRRTLPILSLQ